MPYQNKASAAVAAALERAKHYPHGANPGGDAFADILLQFEQPMGNNIRCGTEPLAPCAPSSSSGYSTSSSDADTQAGMLRPISTTSDMEVGPRAVAPVRVTDANGGSTPTRGRRRHGSGPGPSSPTLVKGRRLGARDRRDSFDARDDGEGGGRPMPSHMARRMARLGLGVNNTGQKSPAARERPHSSHRRSASRASDGGDGGNGDRGTVARSATMQPRRARRQGSSRTLSRKASRRSRKQGPVDTKAQKDVIGQLEAARASSISPSTGRRRRLVPPVLSADGMPDREFLKTRHQYFRDAHAIREAMAKRLLKRRKESMHVLQQKRMAALAGTGNSSNSLYDD